jgi:hypothetical protein
MPSPVLMVIAVLAATGGSRAAAATFDPRGDSEIVAGCYGTYMELFSAPVTEPGTREALTQQAVRGRERLRPYSEAASRVMGQQAFLTFAVRSEASHNRSINGPLGRLTLNMTVREIASEATVCDRWIDAWGAPPETRDAHQLLRQNGPESRE